MEVILIQDTDKLGKKGKVVKVKDGFARNFLIPNKLAIPATKVNLGKLEQEKKKDLLHSEKIKKECEEIKQKLEGLSLTLPVLVQEEEKFYGSIGANEIAHALKEDGLDIDKSFIILDEPIKSLGIYEVPIKLHPEVLAKVKIWIVKK